MWQQRLPHTQQAMRGPHVVEIFAMDVNDDREKVENETLVSENLRSQTINNNCDDGFGHLATTTG